MKYLFVNTASAFSQDYKTHGYHNKGELWEECQIKLQELLINESPFTPKYTKDIVDLGSRSRSFSMWIAKDKDAQKVACVTSLKGVASNTRKDFTGRIIFDSVAFASILSGEDVDREQLLGEHEAFAKGFACAAINPSMTFDSSANMQSFDADLFPFSDIDSFYACLPSSSGDAEPLLSIPSETGIYGSILQLLHELDLRFEVESRDTRRQSKRRANRLDQGKSTTSLRASPPQLLDDLVTAAEEVGSELVGEDRASRLFSPFRMILDGVKSIARPPADHSPRSPEESFNPGKAANPGKPSSANYEKVIINCPCIPSTEATEKLLDGIFRATHKSDSVVLGLSIGGARNFDIVEAAGTEPLTQLLISMAT